MRMAIARLLLLCSPLLLSAACTYAQQTPAPAPRIAAGAWKDLLGGPHPRLIGSREYLRLRAQANPQGYAVAKAADDRLFVGVRAAVEDVPAEKIHPLIQTAMADVAKGATNLHQDTWIYMNEVTETFDFFHDAIPAADRQMMIDFLNAHLATYSTDENAFHNSTLTKILIYLKVAYATWGENPRAKEFRDYALVKLWEGKVLPVLKEFGEGGGYTECGWYTRGSLWNLVEALELARRFEGYDGFAMAPSFFYQRLAYELYQPYPGLWLYGSERYSDEGDGSFVYGSHTEYPRLTRTVLANYYRGSELARYTASKRRKGSNPAAALVDFLYDETPNTALPLAGAPLAHLASGIGKVYARGDWTDDATWLRFECGDFWNNHQHLEVGNFEIFRREPLATESGEYTDYVDSHSVNWLTRTIAHNCILVYQPDEKWSRMRDGGNNSPYANDGGQAYKFGWPVDTAEQWNTRREDFTRGKIVAYQNQPEFMYVAGDCTKAYAPSKLKLWTRQIVFVRPSTFVILDRVNSTRADYPKTWLLHCRNEPAISGGAVSIENGRGSLSVQTLLPARATIRKVQGYTYGGKTFAPAKSALAETANRWRIEVTPSVAQTDDVFLNVLSTDAVRPATLVRTASGVGAKVGSITVVFGNALAGKITVGGKIYTLKPGVVKGKWE